PPGRGRGPPHPPPPPLPPPPPPPLPPPPHSRRRAPGRRGRARPDDDRRGSRRARRDQDGRTGRLRAEPRPAPGQACPALRPLGSWAARRAAGSWDPPRRPRLLGSPATRRADPHATRAGSDRGRPRLCEVETAQEPGPG